MKTFEVKINNRVLHTAITELESVQVVQCLNALLGVDLTEEFGDFFLAEVSVELDE